MRKIFCSDTSGGDLDAERRVMLGPNLYFKQATKVQLNIVARLGNRFAVETQQCIW